MFRWVIWKEALLGLWAHKLRAGLTTFGMVMGITAVIAIVATVEGFQQDMERVFQSMGPNTFMVSRFGIVTNWSQWLEKSRRKKITRAAIAPIQEGCDLCEDVSAARAVEAQVKFGDKKMSWVEVEGQTPNVLAMSDRNVESGRYFSWEDESRRAHVAFIGKDVKDRLFPTEDPIGKMLRIDNVPYTVIGVGAKIGSLFGDSQDRYVIIPLSTLQKQFDGEQVFLMVKAVSREAREDAMDQVRVVMRSVRHVPYDKADDFDILTPDAIVALINSFTFAVRVIVLALPFIAIVIGGIVVMNIMMVSVTERTREIGVRKSLGATRADIRTQFLYESLTMCFIGGIVGALIGTLLARGMLSAMDIDAQTTALAAIVGVSVSTGVGLFFGVYPAMRASRLDPIKALSFE